MHGPFWRRPTYCRALDRSAIPDSRRDTLLVAHTPRTIATYVRDLQAWHEFCARTECRDLPADPRDVVSFLLERVDDHGASYTKVQAYITAINCLHVSNAFEIPRSPQVKALLRRMERAYERKPATPATLQEVHAMCDLAAQAPSLLVAARDRALLLLGWAAALRPNDLHVLQWEHLMPVGNSQTERGVRWEDFATARALVVLVPHSKSDQQGRGQHVAVAAHVETRYCPIRALAEWCRLSGHVRGPLFPRVFRGGETVGTRPMREAAISGVVKRYGALLGLKRSGYSIRRGKATHMRKRGVHTDEIQTVLRHKHPLTTQGYVDRSLAWRNPAEEFFTS